ncbi:MAG: TIGR03546 family protein [Bacteriovoracia bacterium]
MTFLLKQIFGFFKLLHSETGNNQLAWGIALGFVLGMTPVLSLQSLLVFLILFFFRVQIGAAFLAAFFFKFIAFLLDPVFDRVGQWALEAQGLQSLYTDLYNMPIVPFTRFNNSIVMGAGIVAFLLVPFVLAGSKWAIVKYRVAVVERFRDTKLFKLWTKTALYQWYYKYDTYFGN